MNKIAMATAFAAVLCAFPSHATSVCFDPPAATRLDTSDVVVVATVIDKSVKRQGAAWRQTILWRVDETWKGGRYRGSTFTTRVLTSTKEDVVIGQAFLLTLSGREPYEWITCNQDRGLLQNSLEDVRAIQEIFEKQRRPGSR